MLSTGDDHSNNNLTKMSAACSGRFAIQIGIKKIRGQALKLPRKKMGKY